MKFLYNYKIKFFFLFLSFLSTIYFLGLENISPYKIDWLFSQPDITTHYIGWCYFKNDIWHFPFGLNPEYGGANNSIIYSDSIPLLAFTFKFLKFLFYKDFNYFSIWVFICFFFQVFFSYKLIFYYTKNLSFSLISSLYFLLAPVFLEKMSYVLAHGGQFLIIASLYLVNFKNNNTKFLFWLCLALVSLLINFYLFAMVSIIFFINYFYEFLKTKNFFLFCKQHTIYLVFSLIVMYVSGYFTINSLNTLGRGYGEYKFNLLGFFDPVQLSNNSDFSTTGFSSWSLLIDDLPSNSAEYEGFSYLGLGIIFLFFFSLFYYGKNLFYKIKNNLRFNKAYISIFVIFFLFSLSTNVHLGHLNILNIEVNKYISSILGIVRATGRFIWPAYYLIFIFSLVTIFANFNKKKSIFIIIFCLLIQILDTYPGLNQLFNGKIFLEKNKLIKDPFWKNFSRDGVIKTTYEINYNPELNQIGEYACKNKIKTNIYYTARYDRFLTSENRYKIYDQIYKRKIDSHPYLISNSYNHLLDIKDRYKNTNLGFFYLDNLWLIQIDKKNLMRKKDFIELNNIKFPSIVEGQIINAENKYFFGIGWFVDQNKKFAWTDGNISSVLMKINSSNLDKKIIFEIDSSSINKDKINFKIFINDILYDTEELIRSNTASFSIDLTKLNFNSLGDQSLRIDLKFENLMTEFEKLNNINGNLRAFKLKRIYLN